MAGAYVWWPWKSGSRTSYRHPTVLFSWTRVSTPPSVTASIPTSSIGWPYSLHRSAAERSVESFSRRDPGRLANLDRASSYMGPLLS